MEGERSFFDDELPEIGRNIQQGFFETQKKVNSWITTFKKKIDGEEDESRSVDDWAAWRPREIIMGRLKPRTRGGASPSINGESVRADSVTV